MKKVDLSDAFDSGKMFEAGIEHGNVAAFIAKNARGFGPLFLLMKEGYGFAFVENGDEVSVIGVEVDP